MARGKTRSNETNLAAGRDRLILLAVGACFLLSGFAALLYQAAWLKKLGIVFGTSHIAVATVLAAYMAGLAVGAMLAARFVHRVRRPVLVYGFLEALIGISALLVPLMLGGAQILLVALYGGQPDPVAAHGFWQNAYYLGSTFLILLVPTAAMGATLPLLSRYAVREDDQIGPRIGILYGINTIGAVFGALVAGFALLPYLGLIRTLVAGAVVNLMVFVIAVYLARVAQENAESSTESVQTSRAPFHWIMPVMLASGVVSFTLEVLWTRLLSHVFGGTVYAFSIMLASFLAGIGIGGLVAGRFAKERAETPYLFVAAQLAVAIVSLVSYTLIDTWLPAGAGLPSKALYAFVVIFPSTFFIGATYPLAVRIASPSASYTSNAAGRVYAWNTVGAIVGALLTGFFLLPALGFGLTLKVAMLISVTLALVTAVASAPRLKSAIGVSAAVLFLTIVFVAPGRPDRLIYAQVGGEKAWGQERFYGVGRSATILMREDQGFINLTSNGLSESSVGRQGMPPFNLSQKWLAGLPTLARPDAESMLIIGLGGGVALQGVAPHISDLDVIELEPMVIEANRSVAHLRGVDPLDDPRINIVVNDARNAMTLTSKRYDVIVSQPSHPWTGGAAHLYTSEFVSLSKQRLSDGGVFLQWINSQFVDEDLLRILMATLLHQYEYVELYQPERQVLMFLASDAPLGIWTGDRSATDAIIANRRHYNRMGFRAIEDAIAMMTLDAEGVREFAAGAALNTDDHNRMAFFSRARADGLTADTMLELFQDIDPLTNSNSRFHRDAAASLALHHIAEQLLQANFIQRTFKMAQAVNAPDQKDMIDGLGFDQAGDEDRAIAAFRRSLANNPDNPGAQFGLLRMYLGRLAQGDLPQLIAKLANRQQGPDRRVLEGWVFGAAGAFDRLEDLDAELAAVAPTSLAFPIAVKLRVDWRVVASRRDDDPRVAREAMDILDDLLASYWNLDLYILRSGCAYLAGDPFAFVESIGAAVHQVRGRLDDLEDEQQSLPAAEAAYLKGRLVALSERLSDPLTAAVGERRDQTMSDLELVIARLGQIWNNENQPGR